MRTILLATVFAVLCPSLIAQTDAPPIPTYVPVPPTGIGPEIPPSVGYRVEPFGSGAYMVTDGVYQALFFVATNSVIVVDAPPTIGHGLLKGIRTVTDLPISHVVYSHAHADHIGGAYLLFDQNTIAVAHEETTKALAPSIDGARPLPNITFPGDYELCVGNQTLHLSYKGINHEVGNIFIYAPVQKILMLVDVIYPGWVPFERLAESQSIPGWINAHDQILAYDFDHILGGHLNRAGTREDVLIQKEYVTDLYNACAEALQLSLEPANATNPVPFNASLVLAANPNNSWALVKYGSDLMNDYALNKTNEKWLGRLAGVDVYGRSNVETMTESLRLDYGLLGSAGVLN